MRQVRANDRVTIHYTGTLASGEVFDSSDGHDPLVFTAGVGEVIPGFDQAVLGMEEGQEKTVTIPPEEAYGPRQEELLLEIPREELPAEMNPQVGEIYQMGQEPDMVMEAQVVAVDHESITLDANHPLAGEALTFRLRLVAIG